MNPAWGDLALERCLPYLRLIGRVFGGQPRANLSIHPPWPWVKRQRDWWEQADLAHQLETTQAPLLTTGTCCKTPDSKLQVRSTKFQRAEGLTVTEVIPRLSEVKQKEETLSIQHNWSRVGQGPEELSWGSGLPENRLRNGELWADGFSGMALGNIPWMGCSINILVHKLTLCWPDYSGFVVECYLPGPISIPCSFSDFSCMYPQALILTHRRNFMTIFSTPRMRDSHWNGINI